MRKLLLLLLAAAATPLMGQQRMQYSQYLQNAFLVNPAVGGAEPFGDLRTGYSHQWAGFKGAPRGGYLSYCQGLYDPAKAGEVLPPSESVLSLPTPGRGLASPITGMVSPAQASEAPKAEPNFHLGVGGALLLESTGPITIAGASGAFSSHIRLQKELKLSIGMALEMLNYRVDPSRLDLVNPNDVAIADDATSVLLPSLNAGFSLYSRRFFLAGSARQLLQNRVQTNPLNPVISNLRIHYMAQAGYRIPLSDDLSLTPSAVFRYIDPAPPSIDVNLMASYRNLLSGGLSYRHGDALVGILGLAITPTIHAQYAYDFTLSSLRRYSSGSHSLVLGFRLGRNRSEGRRYFW